MADRASREEGCLTYLGLSPVPLPHGEAGITQRNWASSCPPSWANLHKLIVAVYFVFVFVDELYCANTLWALLRCSLVAQQAHVQNRLRITLSCRLAFLDSDAYWAILYSHACQVGDRIERTPRHVCTWKKAKSLDCCRPFVNKHHINLGLADDQSYQRAQTS